MRHPSFSVNSLLDFFVLFSVQAPVSLTVISYWTFDKSPTLGTLRKLHGCNFFWRKVFIAKLQLE